MSTSASHWRVIVLLPDVAGGHGDARAPLAAGAALGADGGFDVVCAGAAGRERDAALAVAAGATHVRVIVHAGFAAGADGEPLLALCERGLAGAGLSPRERALVLLPAGMDELAARLAVRFDGCALGRCSELAIAEGAVTAVRSAYGGRGLLHLTATEGPCFAVVRRWPHAPAAAAHATVPEHFTMDDPLPPPAPAIVAPLAERRRPLEGAAIVVAGGRGMEGEEGFALLADVAARLDAALGGSLPAVDAGWVPVARQVGQSGTYVTPKIYLAVGISGTSQHLAGIGPDTRIVAINRDPDADIFRVATVGIVGDWETVLPALLAALPAPATETAPC